MHELTSVDLINADDTVERRLNSRHRYKSFYKHDTQVMQLKHSDFPITKIPYKEITHRNVCIDPPKALAIFPWQLTTSL